METFRDYSNRMMQTDPLSQLALCCGLGGRRNREYKNPRHYFYSPSTVHFDAGSGWAMAHNPYVPQPQPYILFAQPVIITGNPATSQTNTMTLVQHAQTAPSMSPFQALSIIPGGAGFSPHQLVKPSVVSSQYAIYNTPKALNTGVITSVPPPNTYEPSGGIMSQCNRDPSFLLDKSPMVPLLEPEANLHSLQTSSDRGAVTLNSEVFRQLELIEKQVDLTRDMDLIERHGIVITRLLDPYSLFPHLNEATIKRYNEQFLFNENYVIRFIEIIKRPGQTLGLYIRSVQFEDPYNRTSRAGLVITKIDIDSPVYNSQVLHVGDEILSINLVDIQGMSLDDVVIIMSIPKRLVLALRITKDHDQLLSMNLIRH